MFHYFGYGSNINLIALKAKGVQPVASMNGLLKKWKLTFNVQHWFQHEGGMGNIEFTSLDTDVVEGIVHLCQDEELKSLDTLEAYGIGYDRIEVEVETSKGIIKAYTYVGLPAYINDNCLPTRRYLNIITHGAEKAGLSVPYIDRLKNYPIYIPEPYPAFSHPKGNGKSYSKETLSLEPTYTALYGAVFDMKRARNMLQCLIDIFGGKDMTLFHLKRLDTSDGNETIEDVITGNISNEGKTYLNAYLNEYNKEFNYVGKFIYQA